MGGGFIKNITWKNNYFSENCFVIYLQYHQWTNFCLFLNKAWYSKKHPKISKLFQTHFEKNSEFGISENHTLFVEGGGENQKQLYSFWGLAICWPPGFAEPLKTTNPEVIYWSIVSQTILCFLFKWYTQFCLWGNFRPHFEHWKAFSLPHSYFKCLFKL